MDPSENVPKICQWLTDKSEIHALWWAYLDKLGEY